MALYPKLYGGNNSGEIEDQPSSWYLPSYVYTSKSTDAAVHIYRRGHCRLDRRCMLSVHKSDAWAYSWSILYEFGVNAPPPSPPRPDLEQMYCTRG